MLKPIDRKNTDKIVSLKPGEVSGGLDKDKVDAFLIMVGNRVRTARSKNGISRRMLSELSAVSQRYLAQLESGQGNISIGLLLKIADAMEISVEWLVADADPWQSEATKIRLLTNSATADQRQQILAMLEAANPAHARANRIALIGLRGAGKSTLGNMAADALEIPFLELDDVIERADGMAISEVFSLYGQEGYRRLERRSLELIVSSHETVILAVAGGIASEPRTFDYLLKNYHTVWLRAEPEDHMARVRGQGDERPMDGNPDAMKDLKKILSSREALYSKADTEIKTSGSTPDKSMETLLDAIRELGFLGQDCH